MPTTEPATGKSRSAATPDSDAFASLLEAERTTADAPAAPQTMAAPSPVPQLQTQISTDPTTAADAAVATPADGSAQPTTTATLLTDAAAAPLIPVAVGSASLMIATQQTSGAAAAATVLQASAPVTDANSDASEGAGEAIDEVIAISAAPSATPATGAFIAIPADGSHSAQAATTGAGAVAQSAEAEAGIAPTSDSGASDPTEAAPVNPGGRASSAQTPNQPAAAAAAAQPSAPASDTAIAKPDFASLLASQPAQSLDAPAQTGGQPGEAARTGPTPPALQSAPAATIQVYTRIIERADGRAQRFEIRLDPAELGRVDVRIEIGADRKVHAVLAAHDSAALSDLMRGQRALERALADAGIDLADNGVRFELARDNSGGAAGQQRDSDGRPAQANVWRRFDTVTMPAPDEIAAAVQPSWRPQRLDLVA